jgi:hypothetical protein
MTDYIVPEHYLRNVAKYLGTKPYNEVQDLVNELAEFNPYPKHYIEDMEREIKWLRTSIKEKNVDSVAKSSVDSCCNTIATPQVAN